MHPELGDFVCVRDRRWLVEAIRELGDGLQTLTLPGIDDDALVSRRISSGQPRSMLKS